MILFNKHKIIKLGAGGTQANISQGIIKNYRVIVLNIKEQQKISSILSSVDCKIDGLEERKEKLEELKKG